MFYPWQTTVMIPPVVKTVQTAEGELPSVVGIVQSRVGYIEIVSHQLTADEVALAVGLPVNGLRFQSKIGELLVIPVVLIITVSVVITQP